MEMSTVRASSTDEATKKLSLRTLWKIGDKCPVQLNPSVEGMVVTTKWNEGIFSVVFISPPFKKPGGSWAEAAIIYRTTNSFDRKALPNYDFPFPDDKRILQETIKANGNIEMLQEIVNFLNRIFLDSKTQEILEPLNSSSAWEGEEDKRGRLEMDRVEEGKTLGPSQPLHTSKELLEGKETFSSQFMDKLASEVSKRLSIPQSPRSQLGSLSCRSLFLKMKEKDRKAREKKRKEEMSSTSSSSTSDSSSSSSDVSKDGKQKGSEFFECPFSSSDIRQVTNPKKTMRGKSEERRMLRRALENLYSKFTILKWYVDSLKVECSTAAFKPFPADILWLSHHAVYLDQMLLHSPKGPWKLCNELSLDFLVRAFLELLVRVSPTRAYPECLNEKVWKWMKKKRVGLSSQYGPIPLFLADAKISDAGVQPKGGWVPFPKRENKFIPTTTNKPKRNNPISAEKKPPV